MTEQEQKVLEQLAELSVDEMWAILNTSILSMDVHVRHLPEAVRRAAMYGFLIAIEAMRRLQAPNELEQRGEELGRSAAEHIERTIVQAMREAGALSDDD